MKRIVAAVVLIGLAAAGFFIGWVELALAPGAYGVLFTKSSGFGDRLITAGGITWRWERLIPTNATLYSFDLTPHRSDMELSGRLPSAARYAAEIEASQEDFAFDVTVSLELRIRQDELYQLVVEEALTPDALPEWYDRTAESAAAVATASLLSDGNATLVLDPPALAAAAAHWITDRHPEVEVLSVAITPRILPDPALYQLARAALQRRVAAQQNARIEIIAQLAPVREQARQQAEVLGLFGRTLSEHPGLVDFLALPQARVLTDALMAKPAVP